MRVSQTRPGWCRPTTRQPPPSTCFAALQLVRAWLTMPRDTLRQLLMLRLSCMLCTCVLAFDAMSGML